MLLVGVSILFLVAVVTSARGATRPLKIEVHLVAAKTTLSGGLAYITISNNGHVSRRIRADVFLKEDGIMRRPALNNYLVIGARIIAPDKAPHWHDSLGFNEVDRVEIPFLHHAKKRVCLIIKVSRFAGARLIPVGQKAGGKSFG